MVKKTGILLIILAFLTNVSAMFLLMTLSNYIEMKRIKNYNSKVVYYENAGEYSLTDDYDGEESNFGDFMNDPDSMKILMKTYRKIKNIKHITYMEVSNQDLEYEGRFKLSRNFISGNDERSRNQKIKGEFITPLKSIQCDRLFFKIKGVEKSDLVTGKMPTDKKYSSDMTIPVLVGNAYEHKFRIGEEFTAYYATEKIRFKVSGILKKSKKISFLGHKMNLDEYIVLPVISPGRKDSLMYKKILMSIKCEGCIKYNSKEQYIESVQAIKRIVKETGFRYNVPRIPLENKSMLGWNYKASKALFFAALLSFVIFSGSLIRGTVNRIKSRVDVRWKQFVCVTAIFSFIAGLAIILNLILFYAHFEVITSGISRFLSIVLFPAGIEYYLVLRKRWYE